MDEETKTPEGCTHDCSSCGESCSSRTTPESLLEKPNAGSNVKNMIGIVSGKGGVGKTTLCGLLIQYLCESGKGPVLAVDADANSNLNEVLGVEVEATDLKKSIC